MWVFLEFILLVFFLFDLCGNCIGIIGCYVMWWVNFVNGNLDGG